MDRRSFLKAGALSVVGGTAAFGVPLLGRGGGVFAKDASDLSGSDFPSRFAVPLPQHVRLRPGPDDVYDLTAKAGSAQILTNDMRTPVVGYNGIFPGPLLEVERGVPARVRIRNHLPREGGIGGTPYAISTHLHGSASLPEYDGYASDTTPVGFMKIYEYPNHQPARTMWYHDHGQHWTAQNAYSGLAAMYIVHDDNERGLLPQGEFDVPLIVNDMMFDSDGALAYDDNSHSGLWGDVICVNGRPWPVMKVKRRTYRFRVLNASIARSYRWQLSSSALQFQVVATDGGLMPKGVGTTTIRHGGAERYEFIIDFSKLPSTVRTVELRNRSNENNVDYDYTGLVMRFDVTDEPFDQNDWTWNANYVGMELDPHNEVMAVSESQVTARRNLRVQRSDLTNQWTINEKTWENVINSGYADTVAKVPRGNAVELWRIENRSGGWFHPVHIHLVDFKIVRRSGGVGRVFPYEQGPKDVVYVGESETVDLLVKFAPSPGSSGGHYMVHCHNLPHEDHDMMTQFSVGEPDIASSPHHPMSAPAVPDPTYEGGTTVLPTSTPTVTSTATATSSPTSTSTSTATTAPTSTSTTTSSPTVAPSTTTTAPTRRRKRPRQKK